MPNFAEIQHPDFIRMRDRWRMARCFSKGGIHVIAPDYAATQIWWAEPIVSDDPDGAGGISQELNRLDQRFKWKGSRYESFLWKHNRETQNEYNQRQDRQVHIPLFQSLINIFSAGILRKRPQFATEPTGFWAGYLADVDMRGTTIGAFRRRMLGSGLAFGHVYGITDAPRFDSPAMSRGEQLQRNERPYSYLVSPLQVEDWDRDDYGRYNWVRVTEPYYMDRAPTDKPLPTLVQYRFWYPDRWELYTPIVPSDESAALDWQLSGAGEHAMGRVPIRRLALERPGCGYAQEVEESPLSDALDADRYILNSMSELDELERSQTWALLHIPGYTGGLLDIGPFRALGGGETAVPPSYIAPPANLADSKWARIQGKLWALRQYEGAGRGVAEYSKEERSGEALNIETEDKRNQMTLWASACQDFENGLYEDAALLAGEAPIVVTYPDSFDIKSTAAQVQELVAMSGAAVLTHYAKVTAAIPIMERMMRDAGMPESQISDIKKSMSEYADEEPEEKAEATRQPPRSIAAMAGLMAKDEAVEDEEDNG